jgi:hypothetical protein
LGPPGGVVVEQPRGREVPGRLDHLAGVVGHQVAVAAGHGGRPEQPTARLLVQEPSQEQPIAPEAERGDQLGQPRVLSEPLGRLRRPGHLVLAAAEERQQQQEHVEDVEEDRGREQRMRASPERLRRVA